MNKYIGPKEIPLSSSLDSADEEIAASLKAVNDLKALIDANSAGGGGGEHG